MKRTQRRNKYLKLRINVRRKLLYTKQRNYCVSFIRKSKKEFYANLYVKDINEKTDQNQKQINQNTKTQLH